MLIAYTKVFDTTEINITFYHYPTPKIVEGWYRSAHRGLSMLSSSQGSSPTTNGSI
ncbi:hypothetical protein CL673_03295 [Candidatus Bathyarchaeota archaeon]|jgi:uncharacterized protein YecE (DUF72 family)|nr:hypothetical protein [Candidatus Bathyarchaeota archaeon]MDP6047998.1 DUF72 domain-containing protein [Candidatus Bathyarchaeota archaeon]MDP7206972.1 DUF72 domain-containing protein [Candidatus Bathyarchaeota archaeon]